MEELWENKALLGFVVHSIYEELDKYLGSTATDVVIPNGTGGPLGVVLRSVINNYVARKFNRDDLDPRIMEALGIEEGGEEKLLTDDEANHSYAIQYVLMERMLDSALSMQNIISKNGESKTFY